MRLRRRPSRRGVRRSMRLAGALGLAATSRRRPVGASRALPGPARAPRMGVRRLRPPPPRRLGRPRLPLRTALVVRGRARRGAARGLGVWRRRLLRVVVRLGDVVLVLLVWIVVLVRVWVVQGGRQVNLGRRPGPRACPGPGGRCRRGRAAHRGGAAARVGSSDRPAACPGCRTVARGLASRLDLALVRGGRAALARRVSAPPGRLRGSPFAPPGDP